MCYASKVIHNGIYSVHSLYLCLRLLKHHAMETYGELEGLLHAFVISVINEMRGELLTAAALGGPYTYESGSGVRLVSGSSEPNSSMCGSPRSYVCGEINPSPAPRRARLVRVWAALFSETEAHDPVR
jgi:hypothetical protein